MSKDPTVTQSQTAFACVCKTCGESVNSRVWAENHVKARPTHRVEVTETTVTQYTGRHFQR